ncbi:hypothetical protein Nmel_003793 [Mimus melanotis]
MHPQCGTPGDTGQPGHQKDLSEREVMHCLEAVRGSTEPRQRGQPLFAGIPGTATLPALRLEYESEHRHKVLGQTLGVGQPARPRGSTLPPYSPPARPFLPAGPGWPPHRPRGGCRGSPGGGAAAIHLPAPPLTWGRDPRPPSVRAARQRLPADAGRCRNHRRGAAGTPAPSAAPSASPRPGAGRPRREKKKNPKNQEKPPSPCCGGWAVGSRHARYFPPAAAACGAGPGRAPGQPRHRPPGGASPASPPHPGLCRPLQCSPRHSGQGKGWCRQRPAKGHPPPHAPGSKAPTNPAISRCIPLPQAPRLSPAASQRLGHSHEPKAGAKPSLPGCVALFSCYCCSGNTGHDTTVSAETELGSI